MRERMGNAILVQETRVEKQAGERRNRDRRGAARGDCPPARAISRSDLDLPPGGPFDRGRGPAVAVQPGDDPLEALTRPRAVAPTDDRARARRARGHPRCIRGAASACGRIAGPIVERHGRRRVARAGGPSGTGRKRHTVRGATDPNQPEGPAHDAHQTGGLADGGGGGPDRACNSHRSLGPRCDCDRAVARSPVSAATREIAPD